LFGITGRISRWRGKEGIRESRDRYNEGKLYTKNEEDTYNTQISNESNWAQGKKLKAKRAGR
jgi:hypothetical protein